MDEGRRSNVDPVHVRTARVAVGAKRPVLDERQGSVFDDHRHVLSAGAFGRKNALQGFSTATVDGDVSIIKVLNYSSVLTFSVREDDENQRDIFLQKEEKKKIDFQT